MAKQVKKESTSKGVWVQLDENPAVQIPKADLKWFVEEKGYKQVNK